MHMKLSHRNRGQVQQTKCSLICKIRSLINCNFMPIVSKNKTKIPNRDMQGSGPLCQVELQLLWKLNSQEISTYIVKLSRNMKEVLKNIF